jgi:hypothetical protein
MPYESYTFQSNDNVKFQPVFEETMHTSKKGSPLNQTFVGKQSPTSRQKPGKSPKKKPAFCVVPNLNHSSVKPRQSRTAASFQQHPHTDEYNIGKVDTRTDKKLKFCSVLDQNQSSVKTSPSRKAKPPEQPPTGQSNIFSNIFTTFDNTLNSDLNRIFQPRPFDGHQSIQTLFSNKTKFTPNSMLFDPKGLGVSLNKSSVTNEPVNKTEFSKETKPAKTSKKTDLMVEEDNDSPVYVEDPDTFFSKTKPAKNTDLDRISKPLPVESTFSMLLDQKTHRFEVPQSSKSTSESVKSTDPCKKGEYGLCDSEVKPLNKKSTIPVTLVNVKQMKKKQSHGTGSSFSVDEDGNTKVLKYDKFGNLVSVV